MMLIVNGKEVELNSTMVEELVASYKLKPEHVVVEVDGDIIERTQWSSYKLKSGSIVELVHFVGGG